MVWFGSGRVQPSVHCDQIMGKMSRCSRTDGWTFWNLEIMTILSITIWSYFLDSWVLHPCSTSYILVTGEQVIILSCLNLQHLLLCKERWVYGVASWGIWIATGLLDQTVAQRSIWIVTVSSEQLAHLCLTVPTGIWECFVLHLCNKVFKNLVFC